MAGAYWFIKSGAVSPALTFTFTTNGVPMDLTGKTVMFRMRPWAGPPATYTVNAAATVSTPATSGAGYYSWQSGDTMTPGHYLGEWVINPGNLVLPVDGYEHILISPSL